MSSFSMLSARTPDTKSPSNDDLFTPERMWQMGRISDSRLSPDAKHVLYCVTRYSVEENRGTSVIHVMDISGNNDTALTTRDDSASSPSWSSDGKAVYFLSERSGSSQLWKMDLATKAYGQITDVKDGIEAYGVSPDGAKAYYVRTVHVKDFKSSDVYKDMPSSRARVYDDLMCRHWKYWEEGNYRHIFLVPIVDGKAGSETDVTGSDAAWDTPTAPYFDAQEISWSPDSRFIAYTCKPLTGTEYALSTDSDIFLYDTLNGTTRNINKGEGEEFVGYDKYPVFSPDCSKVAFQSMRRPGNESDKSRLYVYDLKNGTFKDLTAKFDHSAGNVAWADNDLMYFISAVEGTYQIHRVRYSNARVEAVTSGDHDINAFTFSNGRIVAELTTLSSATELYTAGTKNGRIERISDENGDIYGSVKMGNVEKRWIDTSDGKKMLAWVVLPPHFDPAKKYPALLFCEGGPQNTVSQFWSYRWNFQLMAAQGYVVVAPNRRGCPSFGTEWLDQISGDYSGQNIRDYLSAIDSVAAEPWCDSDRLGCVGASYGGYSVFYLAGHHGKRFKAFIAHCGIFNLESMFGQTEELYFVNRDLGGPYWDKANAVAQRSYAASPHRFVDKWDTPILIVTGEYDYRIPYTQSLEAFTAARLHGIPARLLEFEDEGHQVFKPQNSIVWNREFFSWLDRYLK